MNYHRWISQNMSPSDLSSVNLNLKLTDKCNFKCDHCFYGCSGDTGDAYISNETLDKVYYNYICPLIDEGYNIELNLIGGEPTLNLNEFARVIDWYQRRVEHLEYRVSLEMTTNGWWVKKPATLVRFMEIMRPVVGYDGSWEEGIHVRISNSPWHTEHRGMDGHEVESSLESYFSLDMFVEETYWCAECQEYVDQEDMEFYGECPKCEWNVDIEYYTPHVDITPRHSDPIMNWLFVDRGNITWNDIVPSGIRGQNGYADIKRAGRCYDTPSLTFDPDGTHSDGCCAGSHMPFGNVDSDVFELMYHVSRFIRTARIRSCMECRDAALIYKKDNQL